MSGSEHAESTPQDQVDVTDNCDVGDAYMNAQGLPGNGLIIEGSPIGLEKIYDYEPGGHHPLHLGDLLHGRYSVIHKLGSGGYANVWLCRDTSSSEPRYVAVKIIMSEGSTPECPELRINKLIDLGIEAEAVAKHFCLPLDQFSITGPNGTHHALVYPVLGPRVSRLFNKANDDDLDLTLRRIAAQVTRAMSTLHAHGICHGDFRPANILARISNLDGLSEEEVFEIVGKPEQTRVITASRETHDLPTAPQYLVYPIVWEDLAQDPSAGRLNTGDACIIDFGESFEAAKPPSDLGIPQAYRAPEYVLDKKVGLSCDVWAFACTIFEIRTGRRLFDASDDDPDEYLCRVAMMLGKFPEPWWSETWQARSYFLKDGTDAEGGVVKVKGSQPESVDGGYVYQKPEPRSIRESLKDGLFYDLKHKPGGIRKSISEEEIDCLADLLEKLLRYRPEERLGLADTLEHPWFKM